MLSATSTYWSTNDSHFESNNIPCRSVGQGANRTNLKMQKERSSPRGCPFIAVELDTIQVLLRHQEDKSHLYEYPVSNQVFFLHIKVKFNIA